MNVNGAKMLDHSIISKLLLGLVKNTMDSVIKILLSSVQSSISKRELNESTFLPTQIVSCLLLHIA